MALDANMDFVAMEWANQANMQLSKAWERTGQASKLSRNCTKF
jgi:hypothetical protein